MLGPMIYSDSIENETDTYGGTIVEKWYRKKSVFMKMHLLICSMTLGCRNAFRHTDKVGQCRDQSVGQRDVNSNNANAFVGTPFVVIVIANRVGKCVRTSNTKCVLHILNHRVRDC